MKKIWKFLQFINSSTEGNFIPDASETVITEDTPDEDDTSLQQSGQEHPSASSISPPIPPSKRKRPEKDSVDWEILNILKQSSDAHTRRPAKDESLVWAESVGLRMQRMNPRQRAVIRARVEQILLEIEFDPPMEQLSVPPQQSISMPATCQSGQSYATLTNVAHCFQDSSAVLSSYETN